ncbi:hypothetical protein [Lysobacter niastensis]|uniref:hypothetical protein n=1 Tax=Lysobacter niastensis TaxID=380629 RepID=UPI001E6217A9|nr:hypothetical protein [Lysobacter niastensis]
MSKIWMVAVPMVLLCGFAQAADKKAAPAPEQAAQPAKAEAPAAGANGYQPKTKYDNTPYRFNMEQNGKKMSAEEFDAWMKARGIRVAKGAPAKPEGGAAKAEASGK